MIYNCEKLTNAGCYLQIISEISYNRWIVKLPPKLKKPGALACPNRRQRVRELKNGWKYGKGDVRSFGLKQSLLNKETKKK